MYQKHFCRFLYIKTKPRNWWCISLEFFSPSLSSPLHHNEPYESKVRQASKLPRLSSHEFSKEGRMWGEKPYKGHFRGRQDLNVLAKTSVFSLLLSADHSTLNSSSGLDDDGAAAVTAVVGPRRHSSDNELSVA